MKPLLLVWSILLFILPGFLLAREVRVIVALADNATQGIIPIPAKIGNGDDAARNLYWGCSEAFKPVLRASREWELISTEARPAPFILERCTFRHRATGTNLIAEAYRGAEIRRAIEDFLGHVTSERSVEDLPLVAYVGHNGLMDFTLASRPGQVAARGRGVIVLCCMSQKYFTPQLESVGARPLLTTTQLMYPGGFILRAALEGWIRGESASQIADRAARSYAANQKISAKAARGVFAAEK